MLIFLSACLIASPTTCKEERVNWSYEESNYMVCVVQSQAALAEWQTSHPEWRVTRWKCVARNAVPTDL